MRTGHGAAAVSLAQPRSRSNCEIPCERAQDRAVAGVGDCQSPLPGGGAVFSACEAEGDRGCWCYGDGEDGAGDRDSAAAGRRVRGGGGRRMRLWMLPGHWNPVRTESQGC